MTEAEAKTLRDNGAKLYRHVKITIAAVVHHFAKEWNLDASPDDLDHFTSQLWQASHLDDTFHALSSQGYRQLITNGWNPFDQPDDYNWTPSPDCIDNPTTRGGTP